ncbi:unnamed protein product [Adineta steineri]|uniref:Nudix hydrolase domain-containing protein n=1 Tax=Adineta steineri TaxID=433720 RepID=A0A813N2T4_9BILA|nr:unnamed protein product [Adineta steineri]CAF0737033.1 unnamed protein product [Adineta steineri]CAF0746748.1 unnamed protein product [Adineta steineri]
MSSSSSPSNEVFTNELIQQRLKPYLDNTPSHVDQLSQTIPRLKRSRRASVLVPLYCNPVTNRIEVLLIKRSEKMRSHTGMVAFPGGMSDPTDRDRIHTAEREAFEEIGLEPHQYSLVGCLLPITDSRVVVITPVIALLHSPKFVDFRLSPDEATDAFYVDLEQFLFANENYKMLEVGDDFITHHFSIDKYNIWGVTAYELILVATLIYQRIPQFPVYRHEKYLDLQQIMQQQKDFFRLCVDRRYGNKTDENTKERSRL